MNNFTSAPAANPAGEVKVSQNLGKPKKIYTKTDGIFAIIFILLAYIFVKFLFFGTDDAVAHLLGFGRLPGRVMLTGYIIAYCGAVLAYARAKGKRINPEAFFWLGLMLAAAVLFKSAPGNYSDMLTGIYAVDDFHSYGSFSVFFLCVMLARYFTLAAGDCLAAGRTSDRLLWDLASCVAMPWTNFLSIFPALLSLFKKSEKKEDKKPIFTPAFWGGVIGVCILFVILPLLFDADRNLGNMFSGLREAVAGVFRWFFGRFGRRYGFFEFLFTFIASSLTACYQFGSVYSRMSEAKYGAVSPEMVDKIRQSYRFSPRATINVAMYMVCGVYRGFMLFQAGYLFSAFLGKLWGGMTYADYARQGFFQLCAVSGINLCLLSLSRLCVKNEDREKVKRSSLLLSCLSLLLLATAGAKMIMYISAYGLTGKRVVSVVFLLWLVSVFLIVIAGIIHPVPVVKRGLFAGIFFFCFLYIADIDGFVYSFNSYYGYEQEKKGAYALSNLVLEEVDRAVFEIARGDDDPERVVITDDDKIDRLCGILQSERGEYYPRTVPEEYDSLVTIKIYGRNTRFYVSEGVFDDYMTVYLYSQGKKYYLACPNEMQTAISEREYGIFLDFMK